MFKPTPCAHPRRDPPGPTQAGVRPSHVQTRKTSARKNRQPHGPVAVAFVSGVLKTSSNSGSLRPRRGHAVTALVGLLTPELENPGPSRRGTLPARNFSGDDATMAIVRRGFSQTLGYSGGAVPELHRSSLFRRPPKACGDRPPTHAVQQKQFSGGKDLSNLPKKNRVESLRVALDPVGSYRNEALTGQSKKPISSWLRLGCCSLRTALASIWRMRSRVTLKM